jgi:hypothetical protein
MICILLIMLSLTSPSDNPISASIESFSQIESYQVTLRSTDGDSPEEIKYFFKKPGYVRMEFIEPYNGSVLVYNPIQKKVRVRPFNFLKFLVFTLDPESSLLKSSRGHKVDESDIGSLLAVVENLRSHGTSENLADAPVGRRQAVRISVTGNDGYAVEGIHMYHLWLDKDILLPLRVSAYDGGSNLIEDVVMDDLQINVPFPENFFEL